MKAICLIVGFACFAALMLNPGVFAASFEMTAFPSTISICPCSAITPQNVQVSIKNLYQSPDTFTFVLDAPPGFSSQIQQSLTLNPGETRALDLFLIDVGCTVVPSGYQATIRAKSGSTGDTQSFSLRMDVLNCYDVQLNIENKFIQMCKEESRTALFDMVLQNRGKYSDTYDLSASASWAVFSDNPVTIDAGKSKSIGLALTPPSGAMGLQTVNVAVKSQHFYSQDSETVQVDIEDCYQMAAELQPNEVSVCLGEVVNQKVTITNTGIKADTYSIAIPNWVTSDRTSVTLDPKASADVNLVLKPTQKGRTYFNVTVSSSKDPSIAKALPSIAGVSECRGVAVILSPTQARTCQGVDSIFSVSVKNLGTIIDTFNLSANMGTLGVGKVTLNPGETKEIKLTVSNVSAVGAYKIKVTAAAGDVSDEDSADLTVDNCYSTSIDISPQNYSACAETYANYTVALKNTGKLSDSYTLYFASDFLNATRSGLLGPGEARMEQFSFQIPSGASGTYGVQVSAKTAHATVFTQSTLAVKTKASCYSVTLVPKEKEKLVELCKAATVAINVKNTGEKKDEYTITFEGPQWVYLSPNSVDLSGGSTQAVYLYLSPCFGVAKGIYPVKVKAASSNTQAQTEIAVGVVPNITSSGGTPLPNTTNITIPGNATGGGNITGLFLGGWDSNTWKILAIALITIVIIAILAIRFVLLVKK